jgi:hypothetical protein
MISLSKNPSVLEPRKALRRTQQKALKAIAFCRRQRKCGRRRLVGDKQFSAPLISALEHMALIREKRIGGEEHLTLTDGGTLTVSKLK